MSLHVVPPPPPPVPPSPTLAQAALAIGAVSVIALALHPELGWLGLGALVCALLYLLAPVTDARPSRQAKGALALSALALSVAGVHFTLNHAIPGILAGGRRAAARTAVSTLRTIYWAENQARERVEIDADHDGVGEFAYIGELAGLTPRRDGRPALERPILANPIRRMEAGPHGGVAVLGPYRYAVFLPGVGGVAYEAGLGGQGPVAVDADQAEHAWVAYAWPSQYGMGATQAFFINHREEILETRNDGAEQRYEGSRHTPSWDAAMAVSSFTAALEPGESVDGGTWTRWKNKKAREEEP